MQVNGIFDFSYLAINSHIRQFVLQHYADVLADLRTDRYQEFEPEYGFDAVHSPIQNAVAVGIERASRLEQFCGPIAVVFERFQAGVKFRTGQMNGPVDVSAKSMDQISNNALARRQMSHRSADPFIAKYRLGNVPCDVIDTACVSDDLEAEQDVRRGHRPAIRKTGVFANVIRIRKLVRILPDMRPPVFP